MKKNNILQSSQKKKWLLQPTMWLLMIILLGGIIFRFYNTPSRFGFDKDPTRDALITSYATTHVTLPLIGPASGIGPFTFGPWYYYQIIFFSWLVPSPYAPFYYIPFFSLSLIIIMFYVGRVLYDDVLGLILAFFASFSPSLAGPTGGLSNPNLVPPHAAASILLFLLLYKRKTSLWLSLVWGIIMGIGINDHYEMVPLLILPAFFYVINWKTTYKGLLLFIVGIIVSFLPFIYFNSINHWQNVTGMIAFLKNGGSSNYIPNNWHIYLFDFWPKFFGYIFSLPVMVGILIIVLIAVFYFCKIVVKRSFYFPEVILVAGFLILFIGLRYFNAQREYYYFLFLEPLILILVGIPVYFLVKVKFGKLIIACILVIFFLLSLTKNIQGLNANEDQIASRISATMLERRFAQNSITIYNCHQQRIQRAMGVAFLLTADKRLSDEGKKIGLTEENNADCIIPQTARILGQGVYDFNLIEEGDLNKLGWFKITPETVYKNTVLWWTNEKKEI